LVLDDDRTSIDNQRLDAKLRVRAARRKCQPRQGLFSTLATLALGPDTATLCAMPGAVNLPAVAWMSDEQTAITFESDAVRYG
jgi:hypothetical protein